MVLFVAGQSSCQLIENCNLYVIIDSMEASFFRHHYKSWYFVSGAVCPFQPSLTYRATQKGFHFYMDISACAKNPSYWKAIYFKTNKTTVLYFHQHCSLIQPFKGLHDKLILHSQDGKKWPEIKWKPFCESHCIWRSCQSSSATHLIAWCGYCIIC